MTSGLGGASYRRTNTGPERDVRRTFRANEFMSHPVATPTAKETSTTDTRAFFPRSVAMARDVVSELRAAQLRHAKV